MLLFSLPNLISHGREAAMKMPMICSASFFQRAVISMLFLPISFALLSSPLTSALANAWAGSLLTRSSFLLHLLDYLALLAAFLAAIDNKRQKSALYRRRRETVQASGAPTNKGKVKKWYAPARPMQGVQLHLKTTMWGRGESRGGGNQWWEVCHPLWPSLLLSRDRERRTSRVSSRKDTNI